MRTVLLFISCLLIVMPNTGLAQENPGPESGDWALQFQITEDFTLDQFQGSVLSVKYHSSDQNAWRAGLGFDFSSRSSEEKHDNPTPPPADSVFEYSDKRVRLDLQFVRHANPDAKVQFLFGGGPFGSWYSRTGDVFVEGSRDSHEEYDGWSIGISGLVGVEWFVAERVSLHAEYGLGYSYAKTDGLLEEFEQGYTSSREADSWEFGPRGVLLGVSAYF